MHLYSGRWDSGNVSTAMLRKAYCRAIGQETLLQSKSLRTCT
jgi:hypothetical protein